MKAHVIFYLVREGVAYIGDADDGGMSITNDAEAVVAYHAALLPKGTRLVYQDTMGQWDELIHVNGIFVDFAPWKGWTP